LNQSPSTDYVKISVTDDVRLHISGVMICLSRYFAEIFDI